jgi:hypothetical protein
MEDRSGAGDATRTRDIFLGKEVLYQLSYTREVFCEDRSLAPADKAFLAGFRDFFEPGLPPGAT